MQDHAWSDRNHFLHMSDDAVKQAFRDWRVSPHCPWYIKQQYLAENSRRARGGAGATGPSSESRAAPCLSEEYARRIQKLVQDEDYEGAAALQYQHKLSLENAVHEKENEEEEEENEEEEEEGWGSNEEESAASSEKERAGESTHVLRMLYQGSLEEVARGDEQGRKAKAFNRKHGYYRKTWVTSVAQETSSVHPGSGAVNIYEDSSDDDAYTGEQKEIAKEIDELRVAKQRINQEGWDAESHCHAISPSTGQKLICAWIGPMSAGSWLPEQEAKALSFQT